MKETLRRELRSHAPAGIMLAALIFVFAANAELFLSPRNFINILMQTAPMCLLAIGLTFVVMGGNLDLSGGAVIALVSVVCGKMLSGGAGSILTFLTALLLGALLGLFNGICVAKLKMPAFILTMATQIMIRGMALAVSGGKTIYGLPESFLFAGSGYLLGLPVPVWLLILLFAGSYIILQQTVFGYHIHAVGDNAKGARMAGISDTRVQIEVFTLAGLLYALAAVVLTGQLGAAVSTSGDGMEMTALACLAIGGISLSGGRGDPLGTLLGCLIIGVLTNGVNMLNLSPYYTTFIRGMVIFGALVIECVRLFRNRKGEDEL